MWLHFSSIFCLGSTEDEDGMSRVAGSSIFTFQKVKRGHSMAQTGENLHLPVSLTYTRLSWHQLHISDDIVNIYHIRILDTLFVCFYKQQVSWLALLEKAWPSARRLTLNPPLPPEQAAVSSTLLPHIFVSIYFKLRHLYLSASLRLDNRGESRTPQRVRIEGMCLTCDVFLWTCSLLGVTSAFCMTEEEGSVCLHNTSQAQEENYEWVEHVTVRLDSHAVL